MKQLESIKYGLNSRVKLFQNTKKEVFLIVDRKSRVIMKDGLRIVEIAEKIKNKEQYTGFFLKTSAPVCGKTKLYLNNQNIFIKPI